MTKNTSSEKNNNKKEKKATDNVRTLHPKDSVFSYSSGDINSRNTGIEKHNRIVLFLKLLMPSFAVVAIALIILWPRIVEQKDKFRVGMTRPLLVSETENLSIVNSKFFSSDSKKQPFILSADLAIETEPNSRIINMTKPKASILLNSGTRVDVSSDSGILYQQENKLVFNEECIGISDKGHRLETKKVHIDLKDNSLTSNEKTHFYFPQGNIESQGLSVVNKGDIIKFTGKAKMVLTFDKEKTE